MTTVECESRADTLMREAFDVSLTGSCSRRKVGAVLATQTGFQLATASNGALNGFAFCTPHTDHQPCPTSEHAERNAIYACARQGVATQGLHMFCTDAPCHGCARGIIQAGIIKVTYARDYRENQGIELMLRAGLNVTRWEDISERAEQMVQLGSW